VVAVVVQELPQPLRVVLVGVVPEGQVLLMALRVRPILVVVVAVAAVLQVRLMLVLMAAQAS
jgi:hypothetical protein